MAYTITARQALWSKEYAKLLTYDETFFTGAKNDSSLVGRTHKIVLPQSDGPIDIISVAGTTVTDMDGNAVTYPVAPTIATFGVLEYDIIKRGFKPFYILDEDDRELTFNGKSEKLSETVGVQKERIAAVISDGWTPENTENIVEFAATTKKRLNVFGNSTNPLTYETILAAGLSLDRMKIPKKGRRLLVSPTHNTDLLNINEIKGVNLFQPTKDQIIDGKVGRIGGFDVYYTHQMPSFTSLKAKKPLIGATDAATDLEASLAYHPSMVRYGIGDMSLRITKPTGIYTMDDVVEGWARVGSTPAYKADGTTGIVNGIVTLLESKV